ncbi:unnamed protein product [Nezara viridula]|uniref:Uncharacterized protein n=1 Tax=Nezara viridula TaxID=85310 RepID=A0A9P0H670_NEZVI|nr:unnamed protein product [Nezara viridula]
MRKFLRTDMARTTAYHPHRSLENALTAYLDSGHRMDHLNSVLLGLRFAIQEDINASVAAQYMSNLFAFLESC